MRKDDSEPELRIGRWIPPYSPRARVNQGVRTGRTPDRIASRRPLVVPSGAFSSRQTLLLAATVVALASLSLGMLIAGLRPSHRVPPTQEALFVPSMPGFVPSAPASMRPEPSSSAPTGSPSRSGSASPPETAGGDEPTHPAGHSPAGSGRVSTRPPGRDPGTGRPAPTNAPDPAAGLRAGATISLELSDRPGFRVRHRNFLGRVDPIGPASSDLDHADSTFRVHTGLADGGCFSFESTNYPGRFLRHRDFVLHLDRRDATDLFAQDATFCPTPAGPGGVLALRSVNYPSRYLHVRSEQLFLEEQATAFRVRQPL